MSAEQEKEDPAAGYQNTRLPQLPGQPDDVTRTAAGTHKHQGNPASSSHGVRGHWAVYYTSP